MNNIFIEQKGIPSFAEIQVRSDIGGREEQQDKAYVYATSSFVCAMICDGMGGTERGSDASSIAVETLQRRLEEYVCRPNQESILHFMMNTMIEQDERVVEKLGRRRSGTTVVTIIIKDKKLYWFSAGDSRLYIFRDGEMVQATRDHNYYLRLNEQLQKKEITQTEYEKEAVKGEALISFMGVGGLSIYDITSIPFDLQDKDVLLLTTDGLYKALPQSMIQYIICDKGELSEKADTLLKQIDVLKKTKILDNTSFILIRIKGEER